MKLASRAAVFRFMINTVVVHLPLPDPDKGRNPAVASRLLLLVLLSGIAKSQKNK
jgi:hypothetical protein